MCYVLVYTKQQNERKVTNILNNICLLLSIVNANWIVPLFCDSISRRKIRKSLLYQIKTYDFISSFYSIDNRNFKAIKKFIENAYPRFLQNEMILSLNKVFEYYISGLSTHIMQDRYSSGYIALETLVQNAGNLARTKNIKLIPNSVIQTRQRLETFFTKQKIPITQQQIDDLNKKISYNRLSITTCQKYTAHHFGVRFYKKKIEELYLLRNSLFHGDEIKDFNKLQKSIRELYTFLDILLLNILGWTGNEYINKTNNFRKEIL